MKLPRERFQWPRLWMEQFEERAAIKEFSGNIPRQEAERQADAEIRQLAEREDYGTGHKTTNAIAG